MTNLQSLFENQSDENNEKPLKITLAEDDRDDQELFLHALKKTDANAEVTVVTNGQDLVNTLKDPKEENPDIVFVDINMPVKDGMQALQEIKKDEELKDIPAVMLSTSDNEKEVRASFESGANLYVTKPTSLKNFSHILKKIFFFHWTGELIRPIWNRFFISEKTISKGDVNN